MSCQAAGRQTTRVEDKAYSLMGIFGGDNEGVTIFAWKSNPEAQSAGFGGILATSPDDFAESGEYERFNWTDNRQPYSMTNLGLQIRLPLIPIIHPNIRDASLSTHKFIALLNARRRGTSEYLAIYVKKFEKSNELQYERANLGILVEHNQVILDQCGKIKGRLRSPQELFFKKRVFSGFKVMDQDRKYVIFLRPSAEITSNRCHPPFRSECFTFNKILRLDSGSSMTLLYSVNKSNQPFVVMVGIHNSKIWLDVVLDFKQSINAVDLKGIHDSYYNRHANGRLEKNLERTSKYLTDDRVILVEAQNHYNRLSTYMVSIRILDRMHPDVAQAITSTGTFQYKFRVLYDDTDSDLLEAYPSTLWESLPHQKDTMNLFFDCNGISGVLRFQHRNGEKFAIILGAHDNGEMWSDILTKTDCDFDKECVADIRDSYYRHNRRGEKIVSLDSSRRASTRGDLTVHVISRLEKQVGARKWYRTYISVTCQY
ncbi:hypothetical protein BDP27DRAFT_1418955 [Rhodocollybia butyracea]|uniref:Uncharacterized protein n=1 Tax=Rhodocollybia butyracea TaxID=206335 RepID=A0A9P5PY92_9AGAR|nr:hypothetical protein BDP27DRAFT_1418955 [Rhodocollybia butyracea]